ncbi:hypothetical protein DH2020_031558 [Rehmannia glutinosa]|uniref:ABC transporter domain-containing protein n=1 Tax=Rehmannia glutinosa TaxID=99300 RepID=A0ABR0VLP7_REHGL
MELPVKAPVPDRRAAYTIETKNLSYTHKSPYDEFSWLFSHCMSPRRPIKHIIKNVNLEAKPGEITAIAGPSGAGKTTLLEILAGKIPPRKVHSGQDTSRKRTPYSHSSPSKKRSRIALLRLPNGEKTAHQRVKLLMNELGLDHISGSRIGEGSKYGISGGERRRLSIGVELVHDPNILLIDEPTSGLDSSSAVHIVSLLRSMAVNQGKTIILTIHQPGFRILELIDTLVLLSDGLVLHHGSLQLLEDKLKFAGHKIPCHVNILEFAIDITHGHNQSISDSVTDGQQNVVKVQGDTTITSPSYANSHIREIWILSRRFGNNIFRTKELFMTRVAQAVLVGSILGTVYMNVNDDQTKISIQTRLGFFAFSLSFLLSSTTEGLPIFLQERRIFMRETLRGSYRVSSYVTANTIVFFPFLFMVGLLYSTPAYWLVGLRRDVDGYAYFALVVWLVVLMSNSFTCCFSALVRISSWGRRLSRG